MDGVARATSLMQLYSEAQRAVEGNAATLADAYHAMVNLLDAVKATDLLSEGDKVLALDLLDSKVRDIIYSDEMALCVAIDPRQQFGNSNDLSWKRKASKALQRRATLLFSIGKINADEKRQVLTPSFCLSFIVF